MSPSSGRSAALAPAPASACDTGIGYRYFYKAIDVVAAHVPNLRDVLDMAQIESRCHIELGGYHSELGGTLRATRVGKRAERANNAGSSVRRSCLRVCWARGGTRSVDGPAASA